MQAQAAQPQTQTWPNIRFTDEQLDRFVGASGIAERLSGICNHISYFQIEWPEDAAPVEAWRRRFTEIFYAVKPTDEKSIERAYKLKPLIKELNLQYILKHPDDWKSL